MTETEMERLTTLLQLASDKLAEALQILYRSERSVTPSILSIREAASVVGCVAGLVRQARAGVEEAFKSEPPPYTRYEPGIRVGVLEAAGSSEVLLYGYGVYEGDFEAPVGPLGVSWEEYDRLAQEVLGPDATRPKNPRIKLDDGQLVWGMQGWWGPEDKIKAMIGNRAVKVVPVPRLVADEPDQPAT